MKVHKVHKVQRVNVNLSPHEDPFGLIENEEAKQVSYGNLFPTESSKASDKFFSPGIKTAI